MCGILGIFSRSSATSRNLTEQDAARLHHRGPDGQGIFSDTNISLGHTRLSILDLSELGRQPMTHQDGNLTITYNGEVYNYIEIREQLRNKGQTFTSNSDTEVILSAYRRWGPSCLDRFRGMFAFAIWDKQRQALFLARDRCGEKPLYYWQDDKHFIFASELKALIPLLPSPPRLNTAAVDMYLHFQYTPEPFTLLDSVYKLPAAHHATITRDSWHIQPVRYWNIEDLPERDGDPASLIREELERAVILTLRSDVPVGVALSGGIDSGAIAALTSRHYPEPMHAFSVGYPGRPPYDEREQAKELAKQLGMIFHEVELPVDTFVGFFPQLIRIMDEPIADPAAFGHYAIPRAAADLGIKVLLTGIGGDEVFWGYEWTRRSVRANQLRMALRKAPWILRTLRSDSKIGNAMGRISSTGKIPAAVRGMAQLLLEIGGGNTPEDQLVFLGNTPDFANAFRFKSPCYGPAMRSLSPDTPYTPTIGMPKKPEDIPAAVLRLLFETWLTSNCLNLGDRVSMSVGVESRLPFMDKGLIELAMGLRHSRTDHNMGHKAWLTEAMRNVLPQDILQRPKRGFQPPVHSWLSGVVGMYGQQLRDGNLVREEILTKEGVNSLLCNTAPLHGANLFFTYKLVLLENWYQWITAGSE
ncbi:asparagine synthase (glutamine-hydrolyzing) [Nitratidesulfovibrio liaohensis]|uniref:asparagine synthase (glutamine-hydrolyzing) n=1 Tax=Nitratidesulfovibrio liaohensis TaxID=2604158 RepID=A0ABY9QZV0_9BACT|nr:asparagine synthase (glutamine-hydrolyzing) [Nitratidesulfovibrio liaohensis]WMW65046.1 asparagine synthase (glutamine-hydrolyzing) [Nitratidesulfovibrio liaohensis]